MSPDEQDQRQGRKGGPRRIARALARPRTFLLLLVPVLAAASLGYTRRSNPPGTWLARASVTWPVTAAGAVMPTGMPWGRGEW